MYMYIHVHVHVYYVSSSQGKHTVNESPSLILSEVHVHLYILCQAVIPYIPTYM